MFMYLPVIRLTHCLNLVLPFVQINNEDCFYQVVREIRKAERPARPQPAAAVKERAPKKKSLCTIL